ncbi:outer membrane protein assembly factor BamE [Yersinia pekkanenii]|uniref:Lipoprotein n=1 Tax=Yersinia pekkanenii TaxID=1288385 RepID=A0A0T9PX94_9GAMM|nr:outer membrane protein assembly factor BamE [Yersinia pekkanenii]CNH86162.1 putative lipoprotein [Yersinia pekkanenii]CRY63541.1 putative lipoprotein [Yersinia pekkanenii]
MNKVIIAFLSITISIVSGCSSSGNQALKNESQASLQTKLVKNKTTKSDVVKAFGSPTSVTSKNDGGDIYLYEMNNGKINPLTYVPVVGFFAGDTTTESRTLSIIFNKNDTVRTWSFSSDNRTLENSIVH